MKLGENGRLWKKRERLEDNGRGKARKRGNISEKNMLGEERVNEKWAVDCSGKGKREDGRGPLPLLTPLALHDALRSCHFYFNLCNIVYYLVTYMDQI